jgi:hypothetical protein
LLVLSFVLSQHHEHDKARAYELKSDSAPFEPRKRKRRREEEEEARENEKKGE